jgi:bacillithiol system protein YtxJ
MVRDVTELQDIDQLDQLLSASYQRPLVLFKHSYTCGISAEALDEILQHVAETRAATTFAMVTVQTHRDLSNAVTQKLGVRHETPQALLISGGRVVWSASHFRVTATAVAAAVNAHASQ